MGEFLKENRERIVCGYHETVQRFPAVFEEINARMESLDPEIRLAMQYLYMTMPYSDIGNYSFDIFLDYAENSVKIWREYEAVRALPEMIYLNYVLYHRVNEEEIAPCRRLFSSEIHDFMEKNGSSDLLEEKNRKSAAEEVNYWCAQEATYHCSDDRTLSALAVYRRGNGRCGEESVFTVNAMRSIGIPARQVYAPKWSHCDDNHAWVEIWHEGVWYFLGACEPAPLNHGWFTNASSRAMMVHSRWFDTVSSGGEETGKEGMVTMLNELRRYARTAEICVKVLDRDERPVKGAHIYFQVLNYSEFASVARGVTDENGECRLTTGSGSLALQIVYKEWWECVFADTRSCTQYTVVVGKDKKEENVWTETDMFAPLDAPVNPSTMTSGQKEERDARLEKAAAYRISRKENWKNPEYEKFLRGESGEDAADGDALDTLRGELLEVLTEKDRTDLRAEVLEEHLKYALPYEENMEHNLFVSCVLNPRVDDEVLMKYREAVENAFTEEEKDLFREDPRMIWETVDKKITSVPEKERESVITTPLGCLKTGTGNPRSKKILAAAIARTLGIPARLNPEDRSVEYWKDGAFVLMVPGKEKNCRIKLSSGDDTVWKYFQNWSMGKLENGVYTSLRLGDLPWKDGMLEVDLEEGSYRIVTSNRLPNGNIFAYLYHFSVKAGEEKQAELILRKADLGDMLENISLPEFELRKDEAGTEKVKASDLTEEGKHILMFLEESREPTEHILNEMMEQENAFKAHESKIIFVVQSREALNDPTIKKTLSVFPEIRVYYDRFEDHIELLGRRMYVDHEKLPLIIVTDGRLNGIYAASGYNVGTGDMLLRLM